MNIPSQPPRLPRYVGFWWRVLASLVDTVWLVILIIPLLLWVYGTSYFMEDAWVQGPADILINYGLPALAVVLFWVYLAATPGKMVIRSIIVDADTLTRPTLRQCVIRYLGYFVSTFGLFLGFIWVAFDKRKQGWHDKMARTVVIFKED